MKKLGIVFVLVLLCVAGWAGTAHLVGKKAESYYFDLLDQAGQLGFVTLTNRSFERGFLTSRAETLLEVKFPMFAPTDDEELGDAPTDDQGAEPAEDAPPKLTQETFQLVFEHTFHHGPLPYSSGPAGRYSFSPAIALVETRLTEFSPAQESLENLLETIPELRGTVSIAKIRLDGTTDSLFEIPAFELETDSGQFKCSGLTSTSVYSPLGKTLTGSFAMQSVEFRSDDSGVMAWQGMSGDYDLKEALPLFYLGASKVVIGSMDMSVPDRAGGELKVIKLQKIEIVSDSRYDGSMVHVNQITTCDGLTVGDDHYGPLIVDVETNNLDGQALSDFQNEMLSVYRQPDLLDADAIAATVIPKYTDLLVRLLAGDPEFKVKKFLLTTPQGQVDGTFRLKISGVPVVAIKDPVELLQYVQNIDAAAELTVDESLVRSAALEKMTEQQFEQQLDAFAMQKFVVRDGGKLKSHVAFRQGELKVNGQVLPIFQGAR